MKPANIVIYCAIAATIVIGINFGLDGQIALLLNVIFWLALFQGCIALCCAAQLCEGKWINPIKKELLSMYTLIPFCGILYLGLAVNWSEIYVQLSHSDSTWFSEGFTIARHFGIILLTFVVAHFYRKTTLEDKHISYTWAVLYMFSYVACQSIVAFEMVQTLETYGHHRWISTLFGGFYFIQGMYMAMALSAFLCYTLIKSAEKNTPKSWLKVQYDNGLIMHGFSVLWVYLMFSQLIVIWYGNLPEEQVIFTRRVFETPYLEIACVILTFMFAVPFITLIFKKAKASPRVTCVLGTFIFTGVILEHIWVLTPFVKVENQGQFLMAAAIEFVVIAGLLIASLKGHYASLEEKTATS